MRLETICEIWYEFVSSDGRWEKDFLGQKQADRILHKYIIPLLGQKQPWEITSKEIDHFLQTMKSKSPLLARKGEEFLMEILEFAHNYAGYLNADVSGTANVPQSQFVVPKDTAVSSLRLPISQRVKSMFQGDMTVKRFLKILLLSQLLLSAVLVFAFLVWWGIGYLKKPAEPVIERVASSTVNKKSGISPVLQQQSTLPVNSTPVSEPSDAQDNFNEPTNPVVQNELGDKYRKGLEGYPRDLNRAVYWYRKAALQGNADAQNNLANRYRLGEGVPVNPQMAVQWWSRAAEQGHVLAEYHLGESFRRGQGVPKNMRTAVYWYQRAALQGNADAQNNLANRYRNGEGVAFDLDKAVYWWKLSAKQGNAFALYHLGHCYQYGEGVPVNISMAKSFYAKAARRGNVKAQMRLRYLR